MAVRNVEYTPESLMDAAKYLLGIYIDMTGEEIAMYEPHISKLEELESVLVQPCGFKFGVKFADTALVANDYKRKSIMHDLSKQLVNFIIHDCVVDPDCWTLGGDLLQAFQE